MTIHVAPEHLDPTAGQHPRCIAMAEFMREHQNGCHFRDLRNAGFTAVDIRDHVEAAESLAAKLSIRQVSAGGDELADMRLKAREAVQNFRPMPRGTKDTQSLYVAWGAYCAARQALALDPLENEAQKERCVAKLEAYFRLTTAGPAVARAVVSDVEDMLALRRILRSPKVLS